MSSPISATCPHGLRPGTNVCLRCRYDERAADRKRRYLVIARVGIAATGVVVAISLLIVAVMAVAPDAGSASSVETARAETVLQAATPPRPAAPERAAPTAEAAAPKLEPKIAEGRRNLAESMFAVREGAEVTVHFD